MHHLTNILALKVYDVDMSVHGEDADPKRAAAIQQKPEVQVFVDDLPHESRTDDKDADHSRRKMPFFFLLFPQ